MPITLTRTVKILLIAFVAVFLCQVMLDQVLGGMVKSTLALVPLFVIQKGYVWQLLTYSFLHNDVIHLTLNALVLAFVGSDIEMLWGQRRFLWFYFICVFVAGLMYLVVQMLSHNPNSLLMPMLGASGGLYGLLVAYGILFSERTMLFMMLFPMKAKHFVWILAGFELLTTISSGQGALSSVAHLSGMLTGFLLLRFRVNPNIFSRAKKPEGQMKRSHLKLVKTDKANDQDDDTKKSPPTWH